MQAAESTSRRMGKDKTTSRGSAAAAGGMSGGGDGNDAALSEACRVLADIAEPPTMKRAFDTTLSVALLESQLSALESKTGLAMVTRDPRSGRARALTLTGWSAIAGIAAMVVLVLVGGTYAYKRYTGEPLDSTTVVLKSRPRYNRVASGGTD
jgi:Golgi apparatus protein 1